MKKYISFFSIVIVLVSTSFSQKKEDLEKRVKSLEKTVDSLRLQLKFHNVVYIHSDIELNKIRSRLALEINRNFTYGAYFYEGESDSKGEYSSQRVFYFNGYRSVTEHNRLLENNQSGHLKNIRQNLILIRDIVLNGQSEPIKYSDDHISYPNHLIINYYDNASGGEPFITADSETKSLKVRINGILQEVGWE
jgi:hypothetical protein